jgi:two-component system, NarL family, nitrate/nitrite sensor histidine kinase NarX
MDITRKTTGLTKRKLNAPMAAWYASFRARMVEMLVEKRQTVFLGVIVLIVIVGIVENMLVARYGVAVHLLYDAVIFTMLVPIGLWLLLGLLAQTETERKQAAQESSLSTEFSRKLGEANTLEELVSLIVSYPQRITPAQNVILFLLLPGNANMEPEALCDQEGRIVIKPKISTHPDSLPVGSLPQLLLQNGEPAGVASSALPSRYDLPLTRNDLPIGVLKLEFAPDTTPAPADLRALKDMLPVIALALEVSMLQSLAAEQAAASQSQRQQIAQNLHDTLAQNISYLRLKLDQLTGTNAIHEIGVVLQELEKMRATADEAYTQVRNTLEELNPTMPDDLKDLLTKQARFIGQRAGFSLRISQVGTPYPLSPALRQQILYIVREALHNVEKHARATEVQMKFLWLEAELILKIRDDGVGFNPLNITSDGHYGLWIMEHRAQEIGGMLKISPADQQGTEITLWVPRPGRSPDRAAPPAG